MEFFDRARIFVKAGAGGNGSAHFRREKFAPLGGPDGGDGGRGGSVYLVANANLNTLVDFHYNARYAARPGGAGARQKMHGAAGGNKTLKVPVGTVVRDGESGELLADLVEVGQKVMVARGGRGGLGNVHFATATNQAPREAQLGEPGEERWVELELKLLADVGLVGYPNAGKSTLLSVVSRARPKIADYPFTTLVPNLGVVVVGDPGRGDYDSFVMADIPGLIEGAAQGVGLGHEFLRHVERTRLLLHLIDGANVERDPWDEFVAINKELAEHSGDLAARPQIIVLTKMDLPEARDRWPALQARAEAEGYAARAISAATGEGVQDLINYTAERLRDLKEEETARAATEVPATGPVLRPQPDDAWFVEPGDEGVYYVRGRRVERMAAMTNPDSFEGMERLETQLRKLGVIAALEEAGAKPGDTVYIGKTQLEWGDEL